MKLLREPLVHFLALGTALFLLFGVVGDSEETGSGRIVVTTGRIEQLEQHFAATWQRRPTPEELEELIRDYVREEICYREAQAMGLDRDDSIIRRRLRQKLEFLTDDLADASEPTDDQLRDYYAEHRKRYREPDRLSFEQVFLSREERGDAVERDAEQLLSRLNALGATADPATLGDSLLLPGMFEGVDDDEVDRRFGARFAAEVADLPIGRWFGPVESGLGVHVVRLLEREEGRDPGFETVRGAVARDLSSARRNEATEVFYSRLMERYTIVVEPTGTDR